LKHTGAGRYISADSHVAEARGLSSASIRRKLSAAVFLVVRSPLRVQALFGNAVDGVKRSMANGDEGSSHALGDAPTRKLLEALCPGR
jgi:hypothetical protein